VTEPGPPAAGARGDTRVEEPTPAEGAHARRVAEAKATVPHIYLDARVDSEPSTAELVRACALALRSHPRLNGSYRDGRFELHSRVNVGVGVEAGGVLIYPVVADADKKDAGEIAAEVEELATQARQGTITQPGLSGATFSLADLTGAGAERVAATVNRGQAALLAVGGAPGRGRTLTIACDNRIVHAPDAAAFLGRVRELLAGGG
jgi:pyruvate dehydrogenase E2 component (dihydrolipoamide acetyltransferase)